jgi:shikimate kinase
MNLFLIGYRCSGKTTIGKSIAATIDWSFVDSDTRVINDSGKSIKEIVGAHGWPAFRRMERSMMRQICTKDRQVVATGGGAVLESENIRAMKASGMVVWLSASVETIRKRMLQDKNSPKLRPALTDSGQIEEIEAMLLKRNPYYRDAGDFSIDTDDVPVKEIVAKIIQKLSAGLVKH